MLLLRSGWSEATRVVRAAEELHFRKDPDVQRSPSSVLDFSDAP
jgi:hypothetical protein